MMMTMMMVMVVVKMMVVKMQDGQPEVTLHTFSANQVIR